MNGRFLIGSLLLALATLATSLPIARTAGAQDEERYVAASVECVRQLNAEGPLPMIEVTIENQSSIPLSIAYLQSFGTLRTDDVTLTGISLAKPDRISVSELADGESVTVEAPWIGGELKRSDRIVALIVTSAGIFLPACGDEEPQRVTFNGEAPDGREEQEAEGARIAAESLGQLESWLAYPVLYVLLHPDARSEAPYLAMACWYDTRFGSSAGEERQTIFSTDVTKVDREAWIWGVTGEEYADSALVEYEQVIGAEPEAEPTASSMHLVLVDGIWRWFFSGSADGLKDMPKDCGLPEFS
jgi:hypothetical protein